MKGGGEDREAGRLLRRLAAGTARPVRDDDPVARRLVARDLLRHDGSVLTLTESGRAFLRRRLCEGGGFAEQHRTLESAVVDDGMGGRQPVTRNADESPLTRLRRTTGRNGKPLIDDAEFAAGERLRADYTRAQLMPRVTADWSSAIPGGRRGGGMADLADAAIGARRRVEQALAAVGPEFAGVLVDFCCFLKGIEEIEKERCWPVRSAKLVLRLALASLARHYGLTVSARGSRSGIRHWGSDDYRPVVDPQD
ncbi:DUF6456 domain-containing protein [Bauldia litoralis]|uniref:DUF6456 domain-containing protein n=2 Tax=Bauldia litoralis TaxID=665467 RepID=UPI00326406B9